ncbi:MAG TPA: hypothetical protein VG755_18100 [Nannocystaceae bacterium]|nr:hypothetical protein [Nannocystaceae bacterium]
MVELVVMVLVALDAMLDEARVEIVARGHAALDHAAASILADALAHRAELVVGGLLDDDQIAAIVGRGALDHVVTQHAAIVEAARLPASALAGARLAGEHAGRARRDAVVVEAARRDDGHGCQDEIAERGVHHDQGVAVDTKPISTIVVQSIAGACTTPS